MQNQRKKTIVHFSLPRFGLFAVGLLLILGAGYAVWPSVPLGLGFQSSGWLLLLIAALVLLMFGYDDDEDKGLILGGTIGLSFVLSLVFGWVLSSPVFHAADYAPLIGRILPKGDFHDLQILDLREAPLVSQSMARLAAEKRLSERPALGSQFHVGQMFRQMLNGKEVWVGFLEFNGLFTWNDTGVSPGYVLVSAHNVSNVKLVLKVDGKPLRMRYLSSAFFGDNAGRYLREQGVLGHGLYGLYPEVSPAGKPYLIVPLYHNEVGFAGAQIGSVAVLNTQSGSIHTYAVSAAPKWISRIQPKEMVAAQIGYLGEYAKGWLNASFGKQGVQKVSSINTVEAGNGQLYYYVSMTSTGADASISGFYLVDARTKAAKYYPLPGITEQSAMSSAEQVIPQKHYIATSPLPFLVAGVPTYVMALHDSNGVSRDFAMVSIANNQLVAIGSTLESAEQSYLTRLSTNQVAMQGGKGIQDKTVTGDIRRIVASPDKAYLILKGSAKVFYAALNTVGPEALLAKDGDAVRITYTETGISPVPVQAMQDITLGSSH